MTTYNGLLLRQLAKLKCSLDEAPSGRQWALLLEKVSQSYEDAIMDRYTVERSLQLSSMEMRDLYERLRLEAEAIERKNSELLIEIHQRGLAEAALRYREMEKQAILAASLDPIIALTCDGIITLASDAVWRVFGWQPEELCGKSITLLLPMLEESLGSQDFPALAERPVQLVTARKRDGKSFTCELSIASTNSAAGAVLFTATLRDITERLRLESELRQAHKLEAVGQLAAGIAHEINTPIQFIRDNLDYLGTAFSLVSQDDYWKECSASTAYAEVPQAIEDCILGTQRVAGIVKAMQMFAHTSELREFMEADLGEAIRSSVILARSETKEVAVVTCDLAKLPTVSCRSGEICQVVLNLIVNAAHAVADRAERGGKGAIHVSLSQSGTEAVICVSDDGPGIPSAIRHRVFDPFFTTKPPGKGTGQGLSIARAIMDQHTGTITFDTGPSGTTFELRLPMRPKKSPPTFTGARSPNEARS